MNHKEQRLALGEIFRWKHDSEGFANLPGWPPDFWTDPQHDLNALHWAEEQLSAGQAMEYERILMRIYEGRPYRNVICAPGEIRTKALLILFGKWRDQ